MALAEETSAGVTLSQKSHPCVVSGLLQLMHSFRVPDYLFVCDYPPYGNCCNCCTPSACPIIFLCVTILHTVTAAIAALLPRARLSILHTVVMTQPSQSALSEQRVHTGRLAQHMESAFDTLSCRDLPSVMCFRLPRARLLFFTGS